MLDFRSFKNIVVVPFSDLLAWGNSKVKYKGGPIWPEWETQKEIRFNGSYYSPVDHKPDYKKPVEKLNGNNYFFIGPIYKHFGHQIRDFSSRIILSIRAKPNAILVFASHENRLIDSIEDAPLFLKQILKWFEYPLDNVVVITKPTIFDELHVFPEPESPLENKRCHFPNPFFIDSLTSFTNSKNIIKKNTKVYVSRTHFFSQILGEREIEKWFQTSGFSIFYPEKYSFKKQLSTYLEASELIFSEGSSIHLLQLAGKNFDNIYILYRRLNTVKTFTSIVASRAKNSANINVVKGILRFNIRKDEDFAVLDFDKLKNYFISKFPVVSEKMVKSDFLKSQNKQLKLMIFKTMPRTLASSFALIKSLHYVKPKNYIFFIIITFLCIPFDFTLRLFYKLNMMIKK